jgi:hypothetical protein
MYHDVCMYCKVDQLGSQHTHNSDAMGSVTGNFLSFGQNLHLIEA